MNEYVEFTVSRHARRRMARRGVTHDDVRRALTNPSRIEADPDDDELVHAVKRFHRLGVSVVLRVVYNHVKSPWRVVTVFFDRKARRKR